MVRSPFEAKQIIENAKNGPAYPTMPFHVARANNQKKWDDEHPNEVEEDDEEETDTL